MRGGRAPPQAVPEHRHPVRALAVSRVSRQVLPGWGLPVSWMVGKGWCYTGSRATKDDALVIAWAETVAFEENKMRDESFLGKRVSVKRSDGQWDDCFVVYEEPEWINDEARQVFAVSPESSHTSSAIIAKRLSPVAGRQYLAPLREKVVGPEGRERVLSLVADFRTFAAPRAGTSFEEYFTDKGLCQLELDFARYHLEL
jgi:hypothetical protein